VDLRLAGKPALVTGSTAGIGFAIARLLAIEGAHVYLDGRTQERVDTAVTEIRRHCPADCWPETNLFRLARSHGIRGDAVSRQLYCHSSRETF
jgi:NAD(P)-dependent dehydrogenase (short-subunit alcohol dehydrogenase family)